MTVEAKDLHTIPTELTNSVLSKIEENSQAARTAQDALLYQAKDMVRTAQGAISSISSSLPDLNLGAPPTPPTLGNAPSAPDIAIDAREITQPAVTTVPQWSGGSGIYHPASVTMPAPPTGEPDILVPTMPSVSFGAAPVAPAVDFTVVLPTAPELAIPSAPLAVGVALPAMPVLELPTFNPSALPEWDTDAPPPSDILAGVQATIDSSLLEALTARVLGTEPSTVDAAYTADYTRQTDAIHAKVEADVDAAFQDCAARGFQTPTGALLRRVDALRLDGATKARAVSRDLALARLQTELDVYKANLQVGADLTKVYLERDLQAARLALDTHVAAARANIDLYNALVEVFKARQMAAQVEADVYKTQVSAELAKLDAYTKQVDGQKMLVDMTVAQMQGYESQVRGALAQVDIYKAKIDGVRAEVDAKARVLDAYRGEIDAYVAQVNAAKSQYEAYESQVRATVAPVQIYEAKMRGFAAAVDGAKATVEAERIRVDASARVVEAEVQAFNASLQSVTKQGELAIEVVKANAEVERTRISALEAKARADLSKYQAQTEAYRTQNTMAMSSYEMALKSYEIQGNFANQRGSLYVEAAKGAAQVSAQLAASALAGVSVNQSISSTSQMGFSGSSSAGWQYSTTDNHSFIGE